jgi:hypothetical protein
MPNHVTHRVIVTTESADSLAAFKARGIVPDEKNNPSLDFNRFIPMPAELEGTIHRNSIDLWIHALDRDDAISQGLPVKLANLLGFHDFSQILAYPWAVKAGIETRADLAAYLKRVCPDTWGGDKAQAEKQITAKDKYGHAGWYSWRMENWGTKWGAYSFHVVIDEPHRYEFCFDTAWSPPTPIFEVMAKQFPNLRFEIAYYDEFGSFAGYGFLNGRPGDAPLEECDANDRLFELVYGEPTEVDEEEDATVT